MPGDEIPPRGVSTDLATPSPIWVRCADTDLLGHVYYARFFEYFEQARWTFFLQGGWSAEQVREECLRTVVIRAECQYRSPASFGELLESDVRVGDVGKKRYEMLYRLKGADGRIVADGSTTQMIIPRGEREPIELPEVTREFLGRRIDLSA